MVTTSCDQVPETRWWPTDRPTNMSIYRAAIAAKNNTKHSWQCLTYFYIWLEEKLTDDGAELIVEEIHEDDDIEDEIDDKK